VLANLCSDKELVVDLLSAAVCVSASNRVQSAGVSTAQAEWGRLHDCQLLAEYCRPIW